MFCGQSEVRLLRTQQLLQLIFNQQVVKSKVRYEIGTGTWLIAAAIAFVTGKKHVDLNTVCSTVLLQVYAKTLYFRMPDSVTVL